MGIDVLQLICYHLHPLKAAAGEELFREGEEALEFFIVVQGEITLTHCHLAKLRGSKARFRDATALMEVGTYKSGSFFGHECLTQPYLRTRTATAKTVATIQFLRYKTLKELRQTHSELAQLEKNMKELSEKREEEEEERIQAKQRKVSPILLTILLTDVGGWL